MLYITVKFKKQSCLCVGDTTFQSQLEYFLLNTTIIFIIFFFLLSGHLFVEDICVYDNHHALILSMKNTVYMYFSTTKRNVKPVYPNNIAVDHTLWSSSNKWHNDCEISILFWNVWCSVYKLSNIRVYAVIPQKKNGDSNDNIFLQILKTSSLTLLLQVISIVNTVTVALLFTNANSFFYHIIALVFRRWFAKPALFKFSFQH